MTKILIVGDLHLSDRPPTKCTDSYNDDLFALLEEIVGIARERGVDAVAFAGDLFHIKQPSRTSHKTVLRMVEVIQSFHCPVYGVVGNHDIQHDRVSSIFETQPFGVLLQSGMLLLEGWAQDDLPLYGVPWQQRWDEGEPAFESWLASEKPAQQFTSSLLVAHAPLYPPGEELPWENIPAPTVAAWMGYHGHCYYGHVHDLHGVFESAGVWFCNQGALSRGSLQESDFNRKPAVTIWHAGVEGAAAFERVELKTAKPGAEVFRVAEHQVRVDYQARLDGFLAAVSQSTVEMAGIEDVIAHVQGMGLPDPETSLAVEVLRDATSGAIG